MAKINLLPPELRRQEEKLQKKMQRQAGAEKIVWTKPGLATTAKPQNIPAWQGLRAKPVAVANLRPRPVTLSSKRQVNTVKIPTRPSLPSVTVSVRKPRVGFWRRLFGRRPQPVVSMANKPAATVFKKLGDSKSSGRPVAANLTGSNSHKLLSAPPAANKKLPAPQIVKRSGWQVVPSDWVSFFQTFIYLLILIIVLLFYFTLRTTDNYLIRWDSNLSQRASALEKRLAVVESSSENLVHNQKNPSTDVLAVQSQLQLMQYDVWRGLRSEIEAGVKIKNIIVNAAGQTQITGTALDQATAQAQQKRWQKIAAIKNLNWSANDNGNNFDFTAVFTWQSEVLTY